MKKIKKLIFWIIIFIILSYSQTSLANAYISTNKNNIKLGEEITFSIDLTNMAVSAFNIELKFNTEMLEFVSGPDNTNMKENRIITIWYDESGGQKAKNNCELVRYKFKAKKIGNTNINMIAEFFDENGISKQVLNEGIQINVVEDEIQTLNDNNENVIDTNNSKLKELRLNEEGMFPTFSPDITEYYFITENIDGLDVMANPENANSTVNVSGNKNFKNGVNVINIDVTSADGTSKTNYRINVTKTKNLEKANARLENLAIENAMLTPDFQGDVFNYKTEVANTVENLNILAVPESRQSRVEVKGGSNLNYGNNIVDVIVTAEDGVTVMKYIINVYRRNAEEQANFEAEQDSQRYAVERLLGENGVESISSDNVNDNDLENYNEDKKRNTILGIIISIFIGIVVIIGIIYFLKRKRNKV